MQKNLERFKEHVIEASKHPDFIHHEWFTEWHLNIVEQITKELLEFYPEADEDLVNVMVWLHDYGEILDFDNQYDMTTSAGKARLLAIGFRKDFAQKAVDYIALMDRKMEVDLHEAPIEVQIVASADGLSHMVGPFLHFWWKEQNKRSVDQLLQDNINKIKKDWERKIVLPEAITAAKDRRGFLLEMSGDIPGRIVTGPEI